MKLRIKNQIELDGQTECVDQLYQAEWTQKGDYHYLLYTNEEAEKVVLKFHDQELVMTRFSNPKSLMRFIKEEEALVSLPTPMGLQNLVTRTQRYQLDLPGQLLELDYQLLPVDSQEIFAQYRLQISWTE